MARRANSSTRHSPRRGSFRIIGGQWRGRRLGFLDDGTVRPTPDRIRETLFNWLADSIQGARCVDLFAGSGALGLEALSRGAAELSFVDIQAAALAHVRNSLQTLNAQAEFYQGTADAFLSQATGSYDIAFIDPPFGHDLILPTLIALAPHLSTGNRVYLECEQGLQLDLPAGWQMLKAKRAGEVGYHLLSYQTNASEQTHG